MCFHWSCSQFIDSLELIMGVIGGFGALFLFFIGLRRYKREQEWKRKEFIANEIRLFNDDPMVKNVLLMLDWSVRKIELFPDKNKRNKRFVTVNRALLSSALAHHLEKIKSDEDRFTEEEVAIRDHFDRFLSYFERFNQFLTAGMFSEKELEAYLHYWLFKIAHELEKENRSVLFQYIQVYNFNGTVQLFHRYKINLNEAGN
jgi:hypothetical protein